MGSASEDYFTNTHSRYFPRPQDKLLSILHSDAFEAPSSSSSTPSGSYPRPRPAITLQPDRMGSSRGFWKDCPSDVPCATNCTLLGKASQEVEEEEREAEEKGD